MAIYKVGIPISVRFTAPKFQTGLADCKVEVYDEIGVEIAGSPFAMTELNDGAATPTLLGIYEASFTPDAQGYWMVVASSDSKGGRSAKVHKVEGVDVDDLAKTVEVAAVETKVDTVDAVADAIKAKTDALPSDPADQSLVETAVTSAQTSINNNVDAVEAKVDTVDTVVDAVKAKTDNLPSDPADQSAVEVAITAAKDAVNANVDGLETDIKGTGYDPNTDSLRKISEALDILEAGGQIL